MGIDKGKLDILFLLQPFETVVLFYFLIEMLS